MKVSVPSYLYDYKTKLQFTVGDFQSDSNYLKESGKKKKIPEADWWFKPTEVPYASLKLPSQDLELFWEAVEFLSV